MICQLCERETEEIEKHHLIPHKTRREKEEDNKTIDVCTQCGDQIHLMFDNTKLRNELNTLESLKTAMSSYIKWVKSKPVESKFSVKKKKRK